MRRCAIARKRINVHDVRFSLNLFARNGIVRKHGFSQLLVWHGTVHGSRDHFIQFEFGISLVAVLLIQDVATFVVLQPFRYHAGNSAFFQRCGVFGLVPNVLHEVVKQRARQAAQVKTGIRVQPWFSWVHVGLAIVLRGGVPVTVKTVAHHRLPSVFIYGTTEINDFHDATMRWHPVIGSLVQIVQELLIRFNEHDVVRVQVVVRECKHVLIRDESHDDLHQRGGPFGFGHLVLAAHEAVQCVVTLLHYDGVHRKIENVSVVHFVLIIAFRIVIAALVVIRAGARVSTRIVVVCICTMGHVVAVVHHIIVIHFIIVRVIIVR